jgi:ubiquinone/menaquinone biosynthesis C-methylase UbiE
MGTALPSAYDATAACFERQRALPDETARSIRDAVLTALGPTSRPRLLDLGAGSGRIGWPFVAAGDDYVGADLSSGMLRVFADRRPGAKRAMLVQADGCALPFETATFDAVLLIVVFGDLADGRPLADDARRVLRPRGTLIIGRAAPPNDGIDECLKQRLDLSLDEWVPWARRRNAYDDAASYFASIARATTKLVAGSWSVERSPRAFLERHARGARFSRLRLAVREEALRALADWAETEFGTLDAVFSETHRFEMQLFRFAEGSEGCEGTIPGLPSSASG